MKSRLNYFFAFCVFFYLSLLTSCFGKSQGGTNLSQSAQPSQPEPLWLSDIDSVYPDEKYVSAIGNGTDAAASKQNALMEIASYFGSLVSSNVSATTTATQVSVQTDDDTTTTTTKERSVTENINIENADVALFGVEYTEPYYDRKTSSHYTVAFINRTKAVSQFLPQVETDKIDFHSFYDEAEKTFDSDPFTSYVNMCLAEQKTQKYEADIGYLRVVDLEKSRYYEDDAKKLAAFAKKKDEARSKSILCLQIVGDKDVDNLISNAAKKAFSEKGFTVAEKSADAVYYIKCTINDNLEKLEDYGTVIYTVNPVVGISIVKKSGGKPAWTDSVTVSKKQTAVTHEAAKRKCYGEAAKNLESKVAEFLR